MTSPNRARATFRRPSTGYNHDIPYQGTVYHVQTEFLERPTPHIGTQIFCGGRIVEAARAEVDTPAIASEILGDAVKEQHKAMIRRLISGQVVGDNGLPAEASESAPRPSALASPPPSSPRRVENEAPRPQTPIDRGVGTLTDLERRRSSMLVVRAVRCDEPPSAEELGARLSTVMTSLAVIAGRHSHERTRYDELTELLMLRSEALLWLRDREGSPDQGRRLWQGFARIARTLEAINDRKGLVEHDVRVWRRVVSALAGREDESVPSSLLETLKTTWGRDPELDHLLDLPRSLRASDLISALRAAERRVVERRLPIAETAENAETAEPMAPSTHDRRRGDRARDEESPKARQEP